MKKMLMASTAIAGASLFAASAATAGTVGTKDTMNVSMSGYHVFQMRQIDVDARENNVIGRGYSFQSPEGEIKIDANAKTDGGITYGFYVEMGLEGAGISSDELAGYIKGDFGTLTFGNDDGAANVMQIGAYNANGTYQGTLGGTFGLAAFEGTAGASDHHLIRDDVEQVIYGDGNKIRYISPRFSGFQIGASWTPETQSEGDSMNDANGNMAAQGFAYENVGDIAVNYVGEFGDVGVKASAAYIFSDDQETSGLAGGNGIAMEDLGLTKLGVSVSTAGFTVAASYNHNGDFGVARNGLGDGGRWMGIGAMYQMGPWTFNASAARGKQKFGEALLEQTNNRFGIGAKYAVAPGWDIMADYLDLSRENNNGAATPADGDDASAFIFSNKFTF